MRKRFAVTGLMALCTLLYGCNGSSHHNDEAEEPAPGTQEPEPTPETPQVRLDCQALTAQALGIDGLVITSNTALGGPTADTPPRPAHCLVNAYLNERQSPTDNWMYRIKFQLRLPVEWNGRFFFQGGGGTDGAVGDAIGSLPGDGNTTTALAEGYAVVSTDGGHETIAGIPFGAVLFGNDPQARLDYGYNAVGEVTRVAKEIVARHYGEVAHHSYFVGCSNGGRQAMVAASRFADEYDGIIAGNPGFNLPRSGVQHAWDVQHFAKVAKAGTDGRPILATAFSSDELNLVANTVQARCDALDGVEDGMIFNPAACRTAFRPERDLACSGAKVAGTSCLSDAKIQVLEEVFGGPRNSKGDKLYADWPYDIGVKAFGWRIWKLGFDQTSTVPGAIIASMGGEALPYIFMTPPVPLFSGAHAHTVVDYLLGYDFDRDAPGIYAKTDVFTQSSFEFMTPPNPTDLSRLHAKGGKMIVYHGNSDPVFSVNDTIAWYENLQQADAGAADYARLFTIPGQNHCSGGPTTDKFDMLTALVDWVEKGQAPDKVIASVAPGNTLLDAAKVNSRPLCAYPRYARFKEGDARYASSFTCELPEPAVAAG